MSDITPENVTSWRDLADQLTPKQATRLEEIERDPVGHFCHIGPPMSRSEVQANLLRMARSYARDNLAGVLCAEVPDPAGALNVSDWSDWDTDAAIRYFSGRRWVIDVDNPGEAIHVVADGMQLSNGHIDRAITLSSSNTSRGWGPMNWNTITPQQARQFAAALIDAADEVDRWAAK
jgi:hypothetical protein